MSRKNADNDTTGLFLMLAIPAIQVAIWAVSAYLGGNLH